MKNETLDITIAYKVKGDEMLKWEYPTKRELLAIIDHVTEAIKHDAKLERFSIVKNIDLM